MKPIIEFEECLRDSPKFRIAIDVTEVDIDQLELKLEKLVKLCTTMVEAGKVYMNTKVQFINGIWDLIAYFRDDALNMNSLQKLIQTLQEMDKYQNILLDQAKRTICKNLNDFIHTDIKKTKDTKRCFEKYSDEYDQALIRNSQAPKSKQHECEDANNILMAARSGYQHTALDYVFQISMLQAKKRHEILDTLLSYARAHSTFFHQGSDLCQDIDPFMKQLGRNLSKARDDTDSLEKSMDGRHSLVSKKDLQKQASDCQQEGYLFKRTSNTFKTWKRRWFAITNHQLVYCKRSKDTTVTVMEEDLRLCTVKPVIDIDRRFCFEVLSPSKSHVLQADSEEMYNKWVTSLQFSIDAALHHTLHGSKVEGKSNSNKDISDQRKDGDGSHMVETEPASKHLISTSSLWEELSSVAGNDRCCECGSPNPQWASINLGITLCIECSGIHRSLGVHYSKVRSLRLDDWDPELVKIMKELGNSLINKIYEANVDEKLAERPTAYSPSAVREAWIKTKYVQKAFLPKPVNPGKFRLSRQPNFRFSSHPRRRNDALRVDTQKLANKNYETDDIEKGIDSVKSENVALLDKCDNSVEADIPTEIRREKKYSISNSPDIQFKRTAGYFDAKEALPTGLSERANAATSTFVESSTPSRSNVSLEESPRSVEFSLNDTVSSTSTLVSLDRRDNFLGESKELADFMKGVIESDEHWGEFNDDEEEDDDDDIDSNLLLYRASGQADIKQMCVALARGADVNWVCDDDTRQTPIHQAIVSGSVLACEYLFLNGAKMDSKDSHGRTPLHLASDLGLTGQVCLLLKRGADQKAKDKDENDALHYAVKNANADIVTLLRLARLNEEMKEEAEFGNSDETFNEVVRDFSQRASRRSEPNQRPGVGSHDCS